jgi:hypothetical protein
LFPDNNPAAVNQHTLVGHKEVIIDNASSVVTWDGITFLSLDATDKGVINVNTSSSTTVESCVFQNLSTTGLHSSVSVSNSSWILCDTVTASQATFSGCTFTDMIGAASLITDDLGDVTDCTFVSDGSNHAIELTSIGGGSMNWSCTTTGYDAGSAGSPVTPTSTGNESLYVNVGSGTLTVNVAAGATVPSIRSAGATVNVVVGQTTVTVTPLTPNTEVRVFSRDGSGNNDVELAGVENSGTSFQFTLTAGTVVNVVVFNITKLPIDIYGYTVPSADANLQVNQQNDRNYLT